jgi:hypothetical protein
MPVQTRQQLLKLYETFKETNVAFNNNVIEATGLLAKQIFLKVAGTQIPCILYSTSMTSAKVIANISPELFEKIRTARNTAYLRFAFKRSEKLDSLKFFVSSKITGFNPYGKNNSQTNFVSLTYSQRPPDDLITILGNLLTVKTNALQRKEERIELNPENIKKLGLKDKNALILVQDIPRKCLLRDISFSGAKLLVLGLGKFLADKEAVLRLNLEASARPVDVNGKVVRTEEVKGRKDITAIALKFDESKPLPFTKIITNFFS